LFVIDNSQPHCGQGVIVLLMTIAKPNDIQNIATSNWTQSLSVEAAIKPATRKSKSANKVPCRFFLLAAWATDSRISNLLLGMPQRGKRATLW
jgi:hypothetical protein